VSLNQGRVAFQLFIGQFLEEVFSEPGVTAILWNEIKERRRLAATGSHS
jgi:hypothetical protein